MRAVEMYVGDGNFSWVTLSKDVNALSVENINHCTESSSNRTAKLEKDLAKARDYYGADKVSGIVNGKVLILNMLADGKYEGVIWSSRTRISGTYELM